MKAYLGFVLVTIAFAVFCCPVVAATLRAGDILVTDPPDQRLFLVDPLTGNRTIISCSDTSHPVGTGPGMTPDSVAVARDDSILVTDGGNHAIIKIDPTTGNRSYLSSSGHLQDVGNGPSVPPRQITVTADSIYVTDAGTAPLYTAGQSVYRVNPITGDRALASSHDLGVGQGPDWYPWGITSDADGKLFVTDPTAQTVFQVNTTTGDRTIVSSSWPSTMVGTGQSMSPDSIAVARDGNLLVTSPGDDG